jgi:acyl-CoA synthetase (NDP forming)
LEEPVTAQQIIEQARKENRTLLNEFEAKALLREAGINVVETRLAKQKEEAVSISESIGFPVVMKIASADVVHKTDAGGVKLNLKSKAEVGEAYDAIMNSVRKGFPNAAIQGVSVQAMAKPGMEVIVGMSKDGQFGPVLMFGLGGVLVEVLKDVSFRIAPLKQRDASEMIREIKGLPLLLGYRGTDPIDITSLETLLLKVSAFVDATPEIKELDLNPVFAYKEGAIAVDARVVLESRT